MPTTVSTSVSLNSIRYLLVCLTLLLLGFTTNVFARQINLAWNTSTGDVAGYRVYYGTISGNYSMTVDAGKATSTVVANLDDKITYYFAVKAYDTVGNQSGFSNAATAPAVAVSTSTTSTTGTTSATGTTSTTATSTTAATTTTSTTATATTALVSKISATPVSGVAPLLVTLNDVSTGTVSERVWEFGDGTRSTSQSAMKTYNTAGTYTVKLTVKNASGLTSTVSQTISVSAVAPTANFTATPTTGTVPLTVQLADTSTNATSWTWSFGNGTTSNLQTPPAPVYKTAGTYTISLIAKGPGGTSTAKTMTITAKAAATTALPSPWLSKDIGNVGVAGSAAYSNGTYTLKASGADIYGTADAFRFAYQPLNGDGSLVVRVASLSNTKSWTKAGIMIRESLDANARHAMMVVNPSGWNAFQRRTETGGTTVSTTSSVKSGWVKLARSGNVFTASYSADGVTWTVAGSATIAMASNAYIGLVLSANDNTLVATGSFDNVTLAKSAVATGSLPSPWLATDIGNVGLAGSAAYSNGTYTLKASGADIYGTADAFRFAYQPLNGDGSLVVRVASLSNTKSWTKAGIMIRESLDANARHAMMVVNPSGWNAFQRRTETGGTTVSTTSSVKSGWVKLARSGNVFTASYSADGVTWTVAGSATIAMASNAYIGLVLSANDNTLLATANFDNVSAK